MPVTSAGLLSIPFAECRELLAATAEWQSLCAAAEVDEPLDRVHLFDITPPEDDENLTPCVVLLDFDGLQQRKERIRRGTGQLLVEFLLPLIADLTPSEQELTFRNSVGTILQQMLDLAGSEKPGGGYYWQVTGHWKETAPQVITESEPRFGVSEAMWCALVLEWVEG